MNVEWEKLVARKSDLIEKRFFSEKFNDRALLIGALTRNAFLNDHLDCDELKNNGTQDRFHTLGDTILDFIIFDHFAQKSKESPEIRYSPEQLNKFREIYGKNEHLHTFSKNVIELQRYVIWGSDEKAKKRWVESDWILGDLFEALIGAIYIDKGLDGVNIFVGTIKFFENMDKLFSPENRTDV